MIRNWQSFQLMVSGLTMVHTVLAVKPVEMERRQRLVLVPTQHLNIRANTVLEIQQAPLAVKSRSAQVIMNPFIFIMITIDIIL